MNRIMMLLLVFSFMACDEEHIENENLASIKYGVSFGNCLDYCLTDIEINQNMVNYQLYGWSNSVTPIVKVINNRADSFDKLLAQIDEDAFLALDPVIGCPDCADGGSEWLELEIDGRVKRVTFEYGTEIKGVTDLVNSLREIEEVLENEL